MDRIMRAFPAALKKDVKIAVQPLLSNRMIELSDGNEYNLEEVTFGPEEIVYLKTETLIIPHHINLRESFIENESRLSDLQRSILDCIYLKHPNGFIRQRRVKMLLSRHKPFMVPFILQILGQHVVEIIEVLDRCINNDTMDDYLDFIEENEIFWLQTQSRVISYWNAYYRKRGDRRSDYIGQQIVDRLNKAHTSRSCSPS